MAHKMATGRSGADLREEPGVIGSGVVGALAYTWSDSFWFSAVEGEVRPVLLFTAIVFWAILKWESGRRGPRHTLADPDRLPDGPEHRGAPAEPALHPRHRVRHYFRKFKVTRNGILTTLVVSAAILGAIQGVIIPGLVKTAGSFERLFVNSFGLPFNTGVLFTGADHRAHRPGPALDPTQGKVVLNTILLSVTATHRLHLVRHDAIRSSANRRSTRTTRRTSSTC